MEDNLHTDDNASIDIAEKAIKVPISVARLPKEEKKALKEAKKQEIRRLRLQHRKQSKKVKRITSEDRENDDEKPKLLKSDLVTKMRHGLEAGQQVCIDLSFESMHLNKEKASICTQLVLSYAYLKKASSPIHLSLCSLDLDSFVYCSLQRQGVESWYVDRHTQPVEEVFPRDSLIYLSPDTDNALQNIESDKVYVIGGIVDRSVKKNLTLSKAESEGIQVARFPIQEYIPCRVNHILNIDTCLKIISLYIQYQDWSRTLEEAVPQRKKQSRQKTSAGDSRDENQKALDYSEGRTEVNNLDSICKTEIEDT